MECRYNYCVYNKKFKCSLKAIKVDELGQCADCIIVAIPIKKLAKYKRKQLKQLLRRK